VQRRTLRNTHKDSHYCAALFKHPKELARQLESFITETLEIQGAVKFVSMDYKAKV
jgi:hypothetical protein